LNSVDSPVIVYTGTQKSKLVYWWTFGVRNAWRKSFEKARSSTGTDTRVVYVVDEAGIRRSTAGSEWTWNWGAVEKVAEAGKGFLVVQQGIGHWLPFHAFPDEGTRERFARLAAERSQQYVSLSGRR